MLNLFLIAVAFAAIAGYEIPSMLHKKQWRELIAFSVLMLFGFTMSCLMIIGIRLPNPIQGIEFVTTKVYALLAQVLPL
jgi:hypothetical protein